MNGRCVYRTVTILAVIVSLCTSTVYPATGAGVSLRARIGLNATNEGGVAVLGSQYVYVGTSTRNTLHIFNAGSLAAVAHWHLPGTLGYDMIRMALSPDNRFLYVLNQIRSDITRVDVAGQIGLQTISTYSQHNGLPTDLKVSRDGTRLYVLGGKGADIYDAVSGGYLGRIAGADAVASGLNSSVFYLTINKGRAKVHVKVADGRSRVLAGYRAANPLSERTGDVAVSPNGRVVYALWDSFRAFDARTGKALGSVPLPPTPHFNGIALAPNGRQAMLWAPHWTGVFDTPGLTPGYVLRHYGFIAGGVLPIDTRSMRPIPAHLARIRGPIQVAYTSDSRLAFATELRALDVISTGTAGTDKARVPQISLRQPGSAIQPPPKKKRKVSCTVAGAWSFVSSAAGAGPGSGQATLQQSGTSLSGSLAARAVTWSLAGTITHRKVILTFRATGQIELSFSGTVSASGTTIVGNLGNFVGGHARCIPQP